MSERGEQLSTCSAYGALPAQKARWTTRVRIDSVDNNGDYRRRSHEASSRRRGAPAWRTAQTHVSSFSTIS